MTIKELCKNTKHCGECPYNPACEWCTEFYPAEIEDVINNSVTSAIIKTAKILTGSNINGNENKENL